MTAITKAPVCTLSSKIEAHRGPEELELLGNMKSQQTRFLRHIVKEHPEQVNLIRTMRRCGTQLQYRHFENGEFRHAGGCTCKRHLFCAPCNYRRAESYAAAYGPAIERMTSGKQHLLPVKISMTVAPDADPVALITDLKRAHNALKRAKKQSFAIIGGVVSHSFRVVPEGFQAFLSDTAIVDCTKMRSGQLTESRIRHELERACPDLAFTVQIIRADQELQHALCASFRFAGLPPQSGVDHAARWQFCNAVSGHKLIYAYGSLSGVSLPNDSSDHVEPELQDMPFTGETYHYAKGEYHLAQVVEASRAEFPFEHYRPSKDSRQRKRPDLSVMPFSSRAAYQHMQQRFVDLGIEVDPAELPATPEELREFRICHQITKHDLAEFSGHSRYLFRLWESGKSVPPIYAGMLYMLHAIERRRIV